MKGRSVKGGFFYADIIPIFKPESTIMDIRLSSGFRLEKHSEISVTGSKSETNRLLLLQALFPQISLENTSSSDDSEVMTKALQSEGSLIDVHHAGTAMRFLTAYFAVMEDREVVITGSSRMKERPIRILVDALNAMGANISYEEKEGFPPLRIKGRKLQGGHVTLEAGVSSQYISALLLIAPKLQNGIVLELLGNITSVPYIRMTLALLEQLGMSAAFEGNTISIPPVSIEIPAVKFRVESDWSSASYFYSIVALADTGTSVTLSSYKKDSLQGDSALAIIYESFGVKTEFLEKDRILLSKTTGEVPTKLSFDLVETPDIAQTIAVTALGLGVECEMTGLHTLKIKETDRLQALHDELTKCGAQVVITNETLKLKPGMLNKNVSIKTYNDHRMAMAFAPLALREPLLIEDAGVVSKSFPTFWDDLKSLGFKPEDALF